MWARYEGDILETIKKRQVDNLMQNLNVYSSLFIIVMNVIFMFSLWCIDWVGSLYANRFFMLFFIKSYIGTQGEVGWP